jgi:hypothetical protein
MSKYKVFARFTVVMENEVTEVEANSEIDAINEAYNQEDVILDKLRKEHNETVYFEEFSVVKISE